MADPKGNIETYRQLEYIRVVTEQLSMLFEEQMAEPNLKNMTREKYERIRSLVYTIKANVDCLLGNIE